MKKAILIVSFGTTYTETRIKNITAIKNQVSMFYPDTIIEEAVSSRIVRNHMKQDEHIDAKSPLEALMSLKEQGVTGVVVFPTHVIDGIENNQMKNAVEQCRTFFEKIVTADALLSNVDDYTDVSKALWESLKEIAGDSPLIFMGHGTEHSADESYMIIEQALRAYARHPVYIATVEGKRTIQDVIRQMKDEGIVNTRVVLAPFMLVAGDHANNDMAGEDDDSWKSMFEADGSFESVTCQIAGLGRIDTIEQLYVSHTQDAIDSLGSVDTVAAATTAGDLEDGTYSAVFDTDSSMFHVNEACDGRGTLTVKDGKMTIHVSLVSQSIVNLYPGTAEDAQKSGAKLLEPTKDTVTYSDGTSEEVYGFDIPVEALDQEFDLAIIGTKGVWYDHKVSVSDPVAE